MRYNFARVEADYKECCRREGIRPRPLRRPVWYPPRPLGRLSLPPAIHEAAVEALTTMLRGELRDPARAG